MNTLKIYIPNYEKWQTPTATRIWVKISTTFFEDPKIMTARISHQHAPECFLWCIMKADDEGWLEIRQDVLKQQWKNMLNKHSNHFSEISILNALIEAELIYVPLD